jgi:tetratricopeptide (TPR) repeat protein
MRRIVLTLAMLAVAGPLRAGVYNLDPPRKEPSDYVETHSVKPLALVIAHLDELRAIHDLAVNPNSPPPEGSLRVLYEKQFAQLEGKRKKEELTAVDRVNLSACLIRLGRYPKAQELLEESLHRLPPDDPNRVLLLLNLAAIYQEDESLMQRGIQMQREALDHWPSLLLNWTRPESEWYHHVEEYALRLMVLRNAEATRNAEMIRQGGRPPREQPSFDRLFPRQESDPKKKVRFVGASGEYEAGGIAWKEWDRLPPDAEQVVLQLLLWRPHDMRLLWLYGELLNARGLIDWAYFLLNDRLRDKSLWRNRELDQHIRVLNTGDKVYKALFADDSGTGENLRRQALLLWWLAPRGVGLPPVAGTAANEISGTVTTTHAGQPNLERAPAADAAPAPAASMALPDWRQVTVSFITGMIVTVLGVLQWQQWRRKQHSTADAAGSPG